MCHTTVSSPQPFAHPNGSMQLHLWSVPHHFLCCPVHLWFTFSTRLCVCVCVCVRARAERVGVCAWEGGSAEAVNACVAQLRVSQRASWALSNVQIFTLTFPIHDVAQTKIHTFVTCTAALP